MIKVERPQILDSADIERLIADYHSSEGIRPRSDRISWAVALRNQSPGLLLVVRDRKTIIAVAFATYSPPAELGRVLTVNDFYVEPAVRRKGVGKLLAQKLVDEANAMNVDRRP